MSVFCEANVTYAVFLKTFAIRICGIECSREPKLLKTPSVSNERHPFVEAVRYCLATRLLVEVLFVCSCSNGLKLDMCDTFLDAWTVRLGGSNF